MVHKNDMYMVVDVVVLVVLVVVLVMAVAGCCSARHHASTSHKVDVLVWRRGLGGWSGWSRSGHGQSTQYRPRANGSRDDKWVMRNFRGRKRGGKGRWW